MNWFNILKNQIASTSDAQFELDFNNPMIEDDNCKKQLSRLYDKVASIKGTESFLGPKVIVERSGVSFSMINGTRGKQYLDLFPEEVCCKVLETFKSTNNSNIHVLVEGIPDEYSAHVVKNGFYSFTKNGPASVGSRIFMQKGIVDNTTDKALFTIYLALKYESGPQDKFIEVAKNYLNEVFTL